MILYCDFNPRITREYELDDLKKHYINKGKDSRVFISGYGIDCLVFSKHLGVDAKLVGFFGGEKGEFIREKLDELNTSYKPVLIKDESLEEVILKTNFGKTFIRTKTPRITLENEQKLYSVFNEEINNVDLVCLSQSDQENLSSSTYELLIKMCYSKGVKVAVTLKDLNYLKDSKPYMLITDEEQLKDYFKEKLETKQDIIRLANRFLDRGIGVVIVNSSKGTFILTKDSRFYADYEDFKDYIRKININLLLAGIGIGFERKYDFETLLKFGLASAIAENFMKFRMITMAEIKQIMNQIEIKEI